MGGLTDIGTKWKEREVQEGSHTPLGSIAPSPRLLLNSLPWGGGQSGSGAP